MARPWGGWSRSALSALVLTGLMSTGCSPPGETYFIRYELWSDWEATDTPVGGCDGVGERASVRPGATFALIDSDGNIVSSTVIRSGYVDSSRRNTWEKPDRVCAYDLRFERVPSLPGYRILWPNGDVSTSFAESRFAEFPDWTWRYQGSWTRE